MARVPERLWSQDEEPPVGRSRRDGFPPCGVLRVRDLVWGHTHRLAVLLGLPPAFCLGCRGVVLVAFPRVYAAGSQCFWFDSS